LPTVVDPQLQRGFPALTARSIASRSTKWQASGVASKKIWN